MLLKFRVTNHRSIRDTQELSFLATELNEGTAVEAAVNPGGSVRVVPVIGLYGQNAAGKSNVLRALVHLAKLVTGALPWDSDVTHQILGWDPFVLDPGSAAAPTRFEAEILVDAVRYHYGLVYTDEALTGEWLYAYPQGRRQVWFERDAESPNGFRFPDNHLGTAQNILADMARPDRPFLSLGEVIRHDQLSPLVQWFAEVTTTGTPHRPVRALNNSLMRLFSGPQADGVVEMLQRADLGIDGFDLIELEPSGEESASGKLHARREIRLRHRGENGALASLPLAAESDGTIAWLRTMRPLLQVLRRGGVLVVDELDASLHPELAAETIRMFYDRRLNTRNAQLLFSSHDVTMLSTSFGSPLLNRDQVWFTEKDDGGATQLYPLAELKPRKGENIERGYLAGRYGAVPGLSPGELARALWPPEAGEATA